MANRTTYPIETPRTAVHQLYAHATGGDSGSPTLDANESLNGEIVSWTRTGTGTYAIVFRYSYPEIKAAPRFSFVGVTQNMNGRCSAIDVTAQTATFVFCIGGTPTDIPSTDVVYVMWATRNSGKNK
jgi:hypothetical protein